MSQVKTFHNAHLHCLEHHVLCGKLFKWCAASSPWLGVPPC